MKPRVLHTKFWALPKEAPASKQFVVSSMAGYNNHDNMLCSLSFESVKMVGSYT